MSSNEPHEQGDYYNHEAVDTRLATLSAGEFSALTHLVATEGVLDIGSLTNHLEHLQDAERKAEIITALADSPQPEARKFLALGFVCQLTQVNHDAGFPLWKRLMADREKEVRDTAEEYLGGDLDMVVDQSVGGYRGFYSVEALDEAQLVAETGITRQDAYELYVSYAYAENGQCFDLGHAALAKVMIVEVPAGRDRITR